MLQQDLRSMDLTELEALLERFKQPKFRAKQVFDWLHQKRVHTVQEMQNLPVSLREALQEQTTLSVLTIRRKLVSELDGTVKYLYQLPDGECVETVLMKYKHGNSICISSQVGCKMGCAFCASTKAGFVRDLTTGELLEQIYRTEEDLGLRISNVVLMGIGEPLDNFNAVLRFLQLINSPLGANISMRNISLSTCGLVEQIDLLSTYKLGITLSISLHAADDETRNRIMPVNHRWNIQTLLAACKRYTNQTGRRISFEYALIAGENDSKEQALQLAALLKGQLCHVNLIPVNTVKETSFRRSDQKRVAAFQEMLQKQGINATVRRTLGADINAACGQLRREHIADGEPSELR